MPQHRQGTTVRNTITGQIAEVFSCPSNSCWVTVRIDHTYEDWMLVEVEVLT
jgi:hypothetical protein